MALIRGYKQNKYHFCARCGDRAILAQMRWQNGVLLDEKCLDKGVDPIGSLAPHPKLSPLAIVGQTGDRGKHIAKIQSTYTNSKELQPDPMLTEASVRVEDEVSFGI